MHGQIVLVPVKLLPGVSTLHHIIVAFYSIFYMMKAQVAVIPIVAVAAQFAAVAPVDSPERIEMGNAGFVEFFIQFTRKARVFHFKPAMCIEPQIEIAGIPECAVFSSCTDGICQQVSVILDRKSVV